jgi:hypothetical protein
LGRSRAAGLSTGVLEAEKDRPQQDGKAPAQLESGPLAPHSHGNSPLPDLASEIFTTEQLAKKMHLTTDTLKGTSKNQDFTPTAAYKKTPCGAKGSNKLYIKMAELTQAASY